VGYREENEKLGGTKEVRMKGGKIAQSRVPKGGYIEKSKEKRP